MTEAGLRQYLDRWHFTLPPSDLRKPRIQIALEQLTAILGDVAGKTPEVRDLQIAVRAIDKSWSDHRSLEKVPIRYLKQFAWAYFEPRLRDTTPLFTDAGFAQAYWAWIDQNKSGKRAAALIVAYLRHYRRDNSAHEFARRKLLALVEDSSRTRLESWRLRNQEFGILTRDGTRKLVERIIERPRDLEAIFHEAGLMGFLGTSGFVEAAFLDLLEEVAIRLSQDSQLTQEQCEDLLSLFESAPNRLRFSSLTHHTITILLQPWVLKTPPESVKVSLRGFVQRHFGNPNIRKGNWAGVDTAIKETFLRWSAEDMLETFFEILSQTAKARHWQERRAYWRRYLDAGFISDAWLVLGRDAARIVEERISSSFSGSFGTLGGAKASQSVLMLRIRNTIVVEWSHDGSARYWIEGQSNCPRLYERSYHADALRLPGSEILRHVGDWKKRSDEWIRNHTGIRT